MPCDSSEFARRYDARQLGLESTAIPPAMRTDRIVADERTPQYVTFVNPQPAKGLTMFAQIAAELGRAGPTSRSWSSRGGASATGWRAFRWTCRA